MFFLGIDIGSSTTDVVLMDEKKNIVDYLVCNSGFNYQNTAKLQIEEICKRAKIEPVQIKRIVSTGYGRKSVEHNSRSITEISCHAKGIHYLFPEVRAILDIGGQDSKAIQIDSNGGVMEFVMNDKCAAGTGRYLETMARILNLDYSQMGEKSLTSKERINISSVCTVFAETEVISRLAEGKNIEDIINGIHNAVAQKSLLLLKKISVTGNIAITGGVAKNMGVIHCLKECMGEQIHIPNEPQITGAVGAAIFAVEMGG